MDWETRNEQAIAWAREGNVERTYYVLRCDSQKIAKAVDILPQIGILAFAPSEQRTRRAGRGKRSSITKATPIMSGYIIAGFRGIPNWYSVNQLPWIFGVVSRDGRPAPIPATSMEACFDIHQSTPAALPGAKSLRPGDDIRITQGGFTGHEAKLVDIRGADCDFVVSLFGKQFTVTRPLAEVEAA